MELAAALPVFRDKSSDKGEFFANTPVLLKKMKKAGLPQEQRSLLRAFLGVKGNERLLALKGAPFTEQKQEIEAIAGEMAEQHENYTKSEQLAWLFLDAIEEEDKEMERLNRLEHISTDIFTRSTAREPKRQSWLKQSTNPYDQYELGEILLKSEDYSDPEKAEESYIAAAQNGVSDGLFTLGLYHQLDLHDYEGAKNFYEQLKELGNGKGNTGLAILYSDTTEGNPYTDRAKAEEEALEGAEKRSGTAMFVYGALVLKDEPEKGNQWVLDALHYDPNLRAQYAAARQFADSIFANLERSFPDFAGRLTGDERARLRDSLVVPLYASKYNMNENYGVFLEDLIHLINLLHKSYPSLSPKQVMQALGITEELLDQLAAQYASLDEHSKELQEKLKNLDA